MTGTGARLRALIGAAAVLATLVALPSASAAPAGRLELSGAGAASLDLVLRHSSEILPDGFQMKTRGTYAGLAIQDSRGTVVAAIINVQTWINNRPSAADVPISSVNIFQRTILKPGRYKIRLLADGPSTVSVAVTGDLRRKVRATTPYKDHVRLTDISAAVPSRVDTHSVVPADFRGRRYAIVAHHTESKARQAQVEDFCLAAPGSAACTPTQDIGGTHVSTSAGATPNEGWSRGELYLPTVARGFYDLRKLYDARFADVSVDLPAKRYALVVVI